MRHRLCKCRTITHEKEQDEEVPTEATAPLQAHQYGDASGGEATVCCESAEELGGGDSAEKLGGGEEDAGRGRGGNAG